jgi:hypothetical protein
MDWLGRQQPTLGGSTQPSFGDTAVEVVFYLVNTIKGQGLDESKILLI